MNGGGSGAKPAASLAHRVLELEKIVQERGKRMAQVLLQMDERLHRLEAFVLGDGPKLASTPVRMQPQPERDGY